MFVYLNLVCRTPSPGGDEILRDVQYFFEMQRTSLLMGTISSVEIKRPKYGAE
jgi:hypothetical protein